MGGQTQIRDHPRRPAWPVLERRESGIMKYLLPMVALLVLSCGGNGPEEGGNAPRQERTMDSTGIQPDAGVHIGKRDSVGPLPDSTTTPAPE
jgi:hypothetical protein